MDKINEVSKYLSARDWHLKKHEYNSDKTSTLVFKYTSITNFSITSIKTFSIRVSFLNKTKEIVKVWVDIDLNYNELYLIQRRKDLEYFIECFDVVKKALDKLENELVKPMCEKFNLPLIDWAIYEDKYSYVDVQDLEEWLNNETKDVLNK